MELSVDFEPVESGNELDEPQAEHEKLTTGYWQDAWRRLKNNKAAVASLVVVILIFAAAIFGPYLSPYSYTKQSLIFQNLPPSAEHWFGTDNQGYDIYARTIYGARASVLVGVLTTTFTLVVGSTIGVISGFYGGVVDAVLSRVGEVFFAIPLLLGGILFLYTFPSDINTPYFVVIGKVVLAISLLLSSSAMAQLSITPPVAKEKPAEEKRPAEKAKPKPPPPAAKKTPEAKKPEASPTPAA